MSQNFQYENRFQVLFGHEDFNDLNKKVIDVTLPTITIGSTEQPTPIKRLYVPGDSLDIGEINMTFLLDEDYNNYKIILDWINTLRMEKYFTFLSYNIKTLSHTNKINTKVFPFTY